MTREARTALAFELARPVVHSWWTVIAGVCLGLAAGLIAYEHAPKSYRAAALLRIDGPDAVDRVRRGLIRPEPLFETIRPTRDAAADARRIGSLVESIEVADAGPGRVEVAVRDADPGEAIRVVDSLVSHLGAGHEVVRPAAGSARVVAPSRLQVCLLGLALGLMLFAGPPLVRSAVNPPICSAAALRSLTPLPVLARIPRLRTIETRSVLKRRIALNVGLSALSGVVLALAVYRVIG